MQLGVLLAVRFPGCNFLWYSELASTHLPTDRDQGGVLAKYLPTLPKHAKF